MAVDYRAVLIGMVDRAEALAMVSRSSAGQIDLECSVNHDYEICALAHIETELHHVEIAVLHLVSATATAALSALPPAGP